MLEKRGGGGEGGTKESKNLGLFFQSVLHNQIILY